MARVTLPPLDPTAGQPSQPHSVMALADSESPTTASQTLQDGLRHPVPSWWLPTSTATARLMWLSSVDTDGPLFLWPSQTATAATLSPTMPCPRCQVGQQPQVPRWLLATSTVMARVTLPPLDPTAGQPSQPHSVMALADSESPTTASQTLQDGLRHPVPSWWLPTSTATARLMWLSSVDTDGPLFL